MIKSALNVELTFPPVSVGGRWLFSKTLQTSTWSKMYFKTKDLSAELHCIHCSNAYLSADGLDAWNLFHSLQ